MRRKRDQEAREKLIRVLVFGERYEQAVVAGLSTVR
jgi:hypothetical protein